MEISRLLIRYGITSLNKMAMVSFDRPELIHMWLIYNFQFAAVYDLGEEPCSLETITAQRG
jgi:hypothetical protein